MNDNILDAQTDEIDLALEIFDTIDALGQVQAIIRAAKQQLDGKGPGDLLRAADRLIATVQGDLDKLQKLVPQFVSAG